MLVNVAGAELRAAEKELASINRKLEKLSAVVAEVHERMAEHDQSDYDGLGRIGDELREAESQVAQLEDRWLEFSELIG